MDLLCRTVAQRIQEELKDLAVAVCPLRHQRKGASENGFGMTLNCALLLERHCIGKFRSHVEAVSERCEEQGLMFCATGPWPPYNFCPTIGKETP